MHWCLSTFVNEHLVESLTRLWKARKKGNFVKIMTQNFKIFDSVSQNNDGQHQQSTFQESLKKLFFFCFFLRTCHFNLKLHQ